MRRKSRLLALMLAIALLLVPMWAARADMMYPNSDFIETEQPALSEQTKQLIALYRRQPSEQNYLALRAQVIANYGEVLARKEAKLDELAADTAGKPGGEEILSEMVDIVQDMYITYWSRINSSMLRFTDARLLSWSVDDAAQFEFIPVMGAGQSVYIGRTPVTNAQYALYIAATGAQPPANWVDGQYPEGEGDYPVNCVSLEDATAYCQWLTAQDGTNTYRLPTEAEWELAAGHMPKDAPFNCGVSEGRVSVYEYDGITRGAHGAIDFWGNVWEWTSTARSDGSNAVKGGSWASERTDCRTEYRDEARDPATAYEDVGFRVVQLLGGQEPEQGASLAILSAPEVTAVPGAQSISLSWQPVSGALEYQLYEYFADTDTVRMLQVVAGTSFTISGLEPGSAHAYIVQPISHTGAADNVSGSYSVRATCL